MYVCMYVCMYLSVCLQIDTSWKTGKHSVTHLGDEKTIKMENIKRENTSIEIESPCIPALHFDEFFLGWRHSFLVGALPNNPQFDVWTPRARERELIVKLSD
jgi:hypothetical protein